MSKFERLNRFIHGRRQKTWQPKGYPQEYLEGFKTSDDEAVTKAIFHFKERGATISKIVLDIQKGEKSAVVYRARTYEHEGIGTVAVSSAINWSNPDKVPGDYEEYARTFYRFDGPLSQQRARAELLAHKLNVPLEVETKTS